MKTMIICLTSFFLTLTTICAQTTTTWMGGTPGKSSEWNCPTNWKENRIPDENTQVIIPADRQHYPVIIHEVPEIDALLVAGGAKLTINSGASLSILGETGRLNGLTVFGLIVNEGFLSATMSGKDQPQKSWNIAGNGSTSFSSSLTSPYLVQK